MVSKNSFLSNTKNSGDNLKLEPMSGDLKPNSHCNIKMTLTSARYPTNFEGEICCSIDWEDSKVEDTKSVATNTNIPETSEYLFIRLKKRSKIVSNFQETFINTLQTKM